MQTDLLLFGMDLSLCEPICIMVGTWTTGAHVRKCDCACKSGLQLPWQCNQVQLLCPFDNRN